MARRNGQGVLCTAWGRTRRDWLASRRRLRCVVALAVQLVLLLAAQQLRAQQPTSIAPNDRIRVTAPERGIYAAVASLVREQGDSLTIHLLKRNDTITVRTGELTMLQVSVGQRTHRAAGAGLGLLLGVAGGALIAANSTSDGCNPPANDPEGLSCIGEGIGSVIGTAVLGGLAGLLAGAIIGGGISTDKWESIPLTLGVDSDARHSRQSKVLRLGVRLEF